MYQKGGRGAMGRLLENLLILLKMSQNILGRLPAIYATANHV